MSAKSLDENTPKFHSELLNKGAPVTPVIELVISYRLIDYNL